MTLSRFLAASIVAAATHSTATAQYELENAFPNLSFSQPVDLQHAGDGSNRLFVVEQNGVIKVFQNSDTTSITREFLNISSKVLSGGEMGLLGLAFHPEYETNGYFFVYYSRNSPARTMVARYRV
ncbi:MAG: PQQ-dependent sugar dehydrogenase, partial [Bacteroidota bacterium]